MKSERAEAPPIILFFFSALLFFCLCVFGISVCSLHTQKFAKSTPAPLPPLFRIEMPPLLPLLPLLPPPIIITVIYDISWLAAVGIPREHGRLAHVVEAQVQEHDALEPDAGAGVRADAVPEGVDVGHEGLDGDSFCRDLGLLLTTDRGGGWMCGGSAPSVPPCQQLKHTD